MHYYTALKVITRRIGVCSRTIFSKSVPFSGKNRYSVKIPLTAPAERPRKQKFTPDNTVMSANNNQQPPTEKLLKIPVYRVRTIMKSSPDVENIGQESLFMITKATVGIN